MADFGAIRGSKIFISIAAIIGTPLLSCTLGGSHIESLFAYNGRHVVCGSAARLGMREFFDNTQIKAMHAAFEAACVELRMGPSDQHARQRIADAILMVGRQGQAEAELMKAFAVQRFTA